MLTNKEFNRLQGFPADFQLPADFEPFAMFAIDLGGVMNRDENGKLTPAFPSLVGKGVNLWEVVPRNEGMTATQLTKFEAEQREKDRLARLALYASRGYAFDERAVSDPDGGEDEYDICEPDAAGDEWVYFFASNTRPTDRGGRSTRKSVGNANFEGLVDKAQ
jgi:hypothetical protein